MTDPDPVRVAILVACHNDGATLRETIDSLRREPGAELVVVDDGSTDERTIEELGRLDSEGVRVLRQRQSGPSAAWMRGFEATTAPYVMPFSSDDILVRGATAALADALDAAPAADAAWGDLQSFGLVDSYRPSVPVLCPWLITFTNCAPGIALFRREAIVATGGWQTIAASEDWDLWMRMAAQGRTIAYVRRAIFLYRRRSGGRFRGRGRSHDAFYAELRRRNASLFNARSSNRRVSPAPRVLKLLLPVVDKLPGVPRFKKIQLSDALTLLFWTGGLRKTAVIVTKGILFRLRLRTEERSSA